MNDIKRSGILVDARGDFATAPFNRWLGGILFAATVLRIALLVYAEREPARFDYPDTHRYVQVARNIAAGLGPIDSSAPPRRGPADTADLRPAVRAGTDPLYPAILSAGILLGFEDTTAILRFGRLVNVFSALGSIALLALIGRRLISGRAGVIAAGILAIDPILLFFNGLVLTETLFITLLLAGVYCTVRQGTTPRVGWSLAAGLIMGLGVLTRSTGLLLAAMLLPFVVLSTAGQRAIQRRATVMFVIGVIVPLIPVMVRNYRLFKHVVPVRIGSGASLLEAFGPWADGGPGMERIRYPSVPADADEYIRDQIYREAAYDWIRDHPGAAMRLAWVKLGRTWSVTLNAPGYSSTGYQLIGWLTVAPVFLLALIGAYVLRKQWIVVSLLIVPGIYFSLVHMVFVGSVRYRLPAMPLIFLLGGAAIDYWRRRARHCG